jgi:hypothetical protein
MRRLKHESEHTQCYLQFARLIPLGMSRALLTDPYNWRNLTVQNMIQALYPYDISVHTLRRC